MAETTTTRREVLAARIAEKRAAQERLPVHFTERREALAVELEVLVLEWLAAD